MWHGSAVHQRVDSVNPNLERILWLFDVAQAGEADGMVVSERARESDYLDPLLVFFFSDALQVRNGQRSSVQKEKERKA